MSAHDHTTRVTGCFRCELSRDEVEFSMKREIADLEAENERLRAVVNAAHEWCGGDESLLPRRVARALSAVEAQS